MAKKPESVLQDAIIECAHVYGWRVAHFRSVPVKRGPRTVWETPIAADGRGFPDLVLVRERVIFAEIKISDAPSALSKDQAYWGQLLLAAGAEYHVWTNSKWEEGLVESLLRLRLESPHSLQEDLAG